MPGKSLAKVREAVRRVGVLRLELVQKRCDLRRAVSDVKDALEALADGDDLVAVGVRAVVEGLDQMPELS
jgi:hypothetical protein